MVPGLGLEPFLFSISLVISSPDMLFPAIILSTIKLRKPLMSQQHFSILTSFYRVVFIVFLLTGAGTKWFNPDSIVQPIDLYICIVYPIFNFKILVNGG